MCFSGFKTKKNNNSMTSPQTKRHASKPPPKTKPFPNILLFRHRQHRPIPTPPAPSFARVALTPCGTCRRSAAASAAARRSSVPTSAVSRPPRRWPVGPVPQSWSPPGRIVLDHKLDSSIFCVDESGVGMVLFGMQTVLEFRPSEPVM